MDGRWRCYLPRRIRSVRAHSSSMERMPALRRVTAIRGVAARNGWPMAMLFAASHPERTSDLILYGTYASAAARDGYPWGRSPKWMADGDAICRVASGAYERSHPLWNVCQRCGA